MEQAEHVHVDASVGDSVTDERVKAVDEHYAGTGCELLWELRRWM